MAILGQAGRELTAKEARSCQFPIYDDPGKFPDPRKAGPVFLLRAGEQARITELQPFNGWDPSIWGSHPHVPFERMGPAWVPEQLGRLQDLDNIDKHRSVHPTWRAAQWWSAERPPAPFQEHSMFVGALKDGAEIGRWRYPTPRLDLPADMDVNRYFPIGVSLGEPFMYDAVELLDWTAQSVEIVLDLFRPCIEHGGAPLPLSLIQEAQ